MQDEVVEREVRKQNDNCFHGSNHRSRAESKQQEEDIIHPSRRQEEAQYKEAKCAHKELKR